MPAAKKTAQKSPAKKAAATAGSGPGFTQAEKDAMKARAEELKASGRGGAKKADEAQALLDAIEKMPDSDRVLAEKVHSIFLDVAPELEHKTWYGFPSYAVDGKVLAFFKPAAKFGTRYPTLGFTDLANLDDGNFWPTEFALTDLGDADVKKLEKIVRKAAKR